MVVSPERLEILQKARSVWSNKCMKIRELKEHIPKRPVGRPRIRPEKTDLVDNFINKNADKFVFDDEDFTKDDEDITNDDEDITEHTENNEDNGNNEDYEDNEEIVEVVEKVPKKKKIIRKIIKYVEEDDDDNDDEHIQYTNNNFANYNQNQNQMPPNVYDEIIPKQMLYNEFPVNTTNKINFFNY